MKVIIIMLVALIIIGCSELETLEDGICPIVENRSGAYTTIIDSHICVYYGDVSCASVSGYSVSETIETTDGITVTTCVYD